MGLLLLFLLLFFFLFLILLLLLLLQFDNLVFTDIGPLTIHFQRSLSCLHLLLSLRELCRQARHLLFVLHGSVSEYLCHTITVVCLGGSLIVLLNSNGVLLLCYLEVLL